MDNDLQTLLRTLRDDSLFVQMAASSALRAVGEPAVPGLIQALTDEKDTVRAAAARILGEIPIEGDTLAGQVGAALTRALDDPSSVVRWQAAGALEALAETHSEAAREAVPRLIAMLDDDSFPHPSADRAVNEVAANTLHAIGTPAAIEAVEAWWAEGDEDWF